MVESYLLALCLVGATPTADQPSESVPPATTQPERTLHSFRKAYGSASRRVALRSGEDRDYAIRELTDLLIEVQKAEYLPDAERRSLHAQIRTRLIGISRDLKAEIARAERAEKQPKTVALRNADGVLAQRMAAMGGQNFAAAGQQRPAAQAARDRGQELVDLIQSTIAPHTWDVNGGVGSIFYWQPGHALVVRGRGEIHEQVGGAIGQLRRN